MTRKLLPRNTSFGAQHQHLRAGVVWSSYYHDHESLRNMDINQWIESLEYAKPPSEFSRPDDLPHATRKRGRGSRTSSLLEPLVTRESQDLKDHQPVFPVGSSSPATNGPASTSTSSPSSSPSSSSSDKKYQRRSRHHTKADKYHLKSTSKSQPKKTRNKEKEKKPKHARRKKRKGEAITGLVQTFKAKNVPKDRLTVMSEYICSSYKLLT